MYMKRLVYIFVILSVLYVIPGPASAKLGLSLGADLGFDFYSNLEYATFYPTHFTGNFHLTYAIRENWDLGVETSITKVYFNDVESATGAGHHLIPLYELGPMLSYRVWSGLNDRLGVRIRPSLRYVWGYLYDDDYRSGRGHIRVGTYKGFNARFAISAYYGVLSLSLEYDLSQVKLRDIAVEETWFGRMRLKSLDLSGPSVSVGINIRP